MLPSAREQIATVIGGWQHAPIPSRAALVGLYAQYAWRLIAALVATGALLFLAAGGLGFPFFWAFLLLMALGGTALPCLLERELLRERLRPGPGEDADLPPRLALLFGIQALLAGLDARLGWSHLSPALRVCGLLGASAGFAWLNWAMHTNQYFSPVVRLQPERAQRVVTSGPYRQLRHPGYLGALLICLWSGIGLGSWWCVIPGFIGAVLVLRRTDMEDRFLTNCFAGHREYAQRVRWRLIPGFW